MLLLSSDNGPTIVGAQRFMLASRAFRGAMLQMSFQFWRFEILFCNLKFTVLRHGSRFKADGAPD
jgi:hypothetical protein